MIKILFILNLIIFNLFSNEITTVCEEPIIQEFFPVGDTRGNVVLTKKEETRDCVLTKTVLGECLKWDDDKAIAGLPTEAYDSYKTSNFGSSMAEVLTALGAYDQMMHLWSGFKGYCIEGTLQDYSWAEDPMFWGSAILSYFMDSGGLDEAAANVGYETVESVGVDAAMSYDMGELVNMGTCMMAAGANLGTALAEGLAGLSGGPMDCDPIDEICGNPLDDQSAEAEIQTMDKVAFDDLRDQWEESADENATMTFDEMIEIIDDGSVDGVVTYRFHQPTSEDIAGMDSAEVNNLAEDTQELMFAVNMASTAASAASCATGSTGGTVNQAGGGDSQYQNEGKEVAKAAASAAISVASKFAGPFGPAVNLVGQVLLELAASFDPIDTCSDEDDAGQMGSRHAATQKSLKFELCRPLYDECIESWSWGGCSVDAYHSCCYDQILTKVLVVQMMAQLGRDWAHCAGITVSDLNHVSFKQCTKPQMDEEGSIDGATQEGKTCSNNITVPDCWDPTEAFQYKYKCMDLSEFKEYLSSQMSKDMDLDGFDEYWDDLTTSDIF